MLRPAAAFRRAGLRLRRGAHAPAPLRAQPDGCSAEPRRSSRRCPSSWCPGSSSTRTSSCFDVPIATMWVLVVYASGTRSGAPRWWLLTGLAFGCALATKHNAFFLPVVLIPFSLCRGGVSSAGHAEGARRLFLGVTGTFVFAAALFGVVGRWRWARERFLAAFTAAEPPADRVSGGARRWRTLPALRLSRDARGDVPRGGPAGAPWRRWGRPSSTCTGPTSGTTRSTAPPGTCSFHATHIHYAWFYLGELLRGPAVPAVLRAGEDGAHRADGAVRPDGARARLGGCPRGDDER